MKLFEKPSDEKIARPKIETLLFLHSLGLVKKLTIYQSTSTGASDTLISNTLHGESTWYTRSHCVVKTERHEKTNFMDTGIAAFEFYA
jgi:hypothetical protein